MWKILQFILANVIGYCTVIAIPLIAGEFEILPDVPDHMARSFFLYFLGGLTWAWIAGALVSILSFFCDGFPRRFFLSLPLIIPIIYGCVIISLYTI